MVLQLLKNSLDVSYMVNLVVHVPFSTHFDGSSPDVRIFIEWLMQHSIMTSPHRIVEGANDLFSPHANLTWPIPDTLS